MSLCRPAVEPSGFNVLGFVGAFGDFFQWSNIMSACVSIRSPVVEPSGFRVLGFVGALGDFFQ